MSIFTTIKQVSIITKLNNTDKNTKLTCPSPLYLNSSNKLNNTNRLKKEQTNPGIPIITTRNETSSKLYINRKTNNDPGDPLSR